MIPFPLSVAVLLAAWPAAWAYLQAAALRRALWRRPVRVALIAAVIALPLLTRGPGAVQLTLGLLAGYLGIRIVALGSSRGGARGQRAAAGGMTTFAAVASFEDLLQPVAGDPARLLPRALALGLLGAVSCAGLLWAGAVVRLWRWSPYLDDLLVCLEVAVGTMAVNNLIIAGAAARGRAVRGLQERPAMAASLAEFWAVRWNHLVEHNLDRGFFRPLCRRGLPALGVLATFVASGVMHVIPVLAAAPPAVALRPAAAVMGFFLLHGALVLTERATGHHRPPPPGPALTRARLRTVTLFVLLSPIMLGPFAEICGVHGRSLGH